jgi:2-C-methyl-D-erythritol 2,4-cyclodiphosphate synthase
VNLRIGQGFDAHRFSDDASRALVLGGVVIPGSPGLAGHSDADALAHALSDALLGAASLGDIGQRFPDTDPRYAGADSMGLLSEVVLLVSGAGFGALNADCTVIAERPKLSAHLPAMADGLSAAIGAPVSVKATRGEGLGAIGRAEGIACLAVVLLDSR